MRCVNQNRVKFTFKLSVKDQAKIKNRAQGLNLESQHLI